VRGALFDQMPDGSTPLAIPRIVGAYGGAFARTKSEESALMRVLILVFLIALPAAAQRYTSADGKIRVALAKPPFSPTGTSVGPTTMANGGIQHQLGATVRVDEAALSTDEATEYGAWSGRSSIG
jgi:hypothetical protein